MPIKGEKQRKIKQLEAGKGVRAPKKYWHKIARETKEEYPNLGQKRVAMIAGKRWSNISMSEKIRIVKKWQQ